MLEAGRQAPDFTLPDQNDEELSLADLRGQTVVLYFYPRADTMINSIGLTKSPKPGGLRNRRQAATTSTGQAPERTRS